MSDNIISTGSDGLDKVLRGGLPKGSVIILEGTPGSGKTTLAFQFLYQGAISSQESGIYVTFEELPAQLYSDMAHFGWDMRQLEKNNQLRVICLTPKTLLEQIQHPDGLFDKLVDEIGCKRIVIDSVSLFRFGLSGEDEHRKIIYQLRNILRKKGLTSLLIREQSESQTDQVPFENFVADGVIRLTVKPHLERFRERILEITKMRGVNYMEGEHVYRITDEGIHVIPSLHIFDDSKVASVKKCFYTGITKLDKILGGGIPQGSVFMFDTNSRADYKHLFGSIETSLIKQGVKGAILPSSTHSISDIEELYRMHGLSTQELIDEQRVYFIEHYDRPYPASFSPGVIDVSNMDDNQFNTHIRNELGPIIGGSIQKGESWFAYYDINTIISERGKNFVTKYFAQQAANARAHGITLLALCNFKEIGEATASFLERTSDGVIRTWVNRTYQYLQVTKLPGGHVSDIHIVEHTSNEPYVRLV